MNNLNVLNNEASNNFATMPNATAQPTNLNEKVVEQDARIKALQKQAAVNSGKILMAKQNEMLNPDGTINLAMFKEKYKDASFNANIVSTISKSETWKNKSTQDVTIRFTRVPLRAFASLTDNFQYQIDGETAVYALGLNETSTKLSVLVSQGKLSTNVSIAAIFVGATKDISCHIRIVDSTLEKSFNEIIGKTVETPQTPKAASVELGAK